MSDSFAKTTRSFVCRDTLWETLSEVAAELECTVDYLVNDAIKLYVRQRLTRRAPPEERPRTSTPTDPLILAPPAVPRPLPPPLPPPARPVPPAPPLVGATTRRLPPPLPPAIAPAPRLTVSYGALTKIVEGPAFVIGRSKGSELAIKDPNVSRQHARVELQGGVYYLVDHGSVNGIWVNGERISRRPIADGDVATICDHSIRFAFLRPGERI